jgi:hypothetical protein
MRIDYPFSFDPPQRRNTNDSIPAVIIYYPLGKMLDAGYWMPGTG